MPIQPLQQIFVFPKPTIQVLEKGCEICSKLTIKTPEQRHLYC